MINMVKLPTSKSELFLRVAKGHFATSHSHINYYIDVTTQKTRLSEAKAVAKELVSAYQHSTIVDTVLCLDGTQVIGTCLANELTKDGFTNMNAHKTIYIVTPEYTSGSQIILRDNLAPMVKGKHVLILAASITTGYTIQAAVEAVNYYGGIVAGLSAIFATTHECLGYPVTSIFDPTSLPDYASFDSRDCPLCKAGQHIDALVNSFRLFGAVNRTNLELPHPSGSSFLLSPGRDCAILIPDETRRTRYQVHENSRKRFYPRRQVPCRRRVCYGAIANSAPGYQDHPRLYRA